MEHLLGIFIACSAREADLMGEVLKADANAEVWVYFDRVQIKAPESYDARKCADLFARFVKNGTWQVPTLISEHNYWHIAETQAPGDPLFRYIPRDWVKKELELVNNAVLKERTAADVASGKQLFRKQIGLVSAMHRAGVRLLAGTDTPGWFALPGFSLHDELALLVAAGLTPLAALQTATINPAKFVGREKELGTVEKGKLADLVLLDANPLSDINNTRKISAVVVNGRYLPKETLQKMLAEVEAAANQ